MPERSGRHLELLKALVVAGARPNFMKVAPVLRVLASRGHECILVHTGQHYDYAMSSSFFEDLGIQEPNHYLAAGSGSHAVQTARIMEAFEPVLIAERPDWLVVVGDVNSTVACSLVAVKLRQELGTRIAHLEAGLRSSDWRMPEEVNRVVTDRLSDLLLTPSRDAAPNLTAEGIAAERIVFVGNVMIDTLNASLEKARALEQPARLGLLPGEYAVATIHRPSNVDSPETIGVILEAFRSIARRSAVVLPLHPRTKKNIERFGLEADLSGIITTEPLGYSELLGLMADARCVLTDSGGIQEETTALGVPCVTLREQTERPVTILEGTNRLAPWPLTVEGIVRAFDDAVMDHSGGREAPEKWDGRAAERVVDALEQHLSIG